MTDLLLVRHGESEWNALGRWQGQADPPLSERGRQQARHAASGLAPMARIVASDLRRASESADLIAAAWRSAGRTPLDPRGTDRTADSGAAGIATSPVERIAGLRERHAGPWQGLTRVEIEAAWPGYLDAGRRPPDFEVDEVLLVRVLEALGALVDGPPTLVVTHAGVLKALERVHGIEQGRIANLGGRWWRAERAPGSRPFDASDLEPGDPVVLVGEDEVTRPDET